MNPMVSIILPYYEGLRWLPQAVESVREQTEKAWELIVVDDGSKIPAQPVIDRIGDPRIRTITTTHGGKGNALNIGVGEARAEHICFLDQDDLMLPKRLVTQMKALEKAPEAHGVCSGYERRHVGGTLIDRVDSRQVSAKEAIHLMATGRSPVTMQTLMLKKSMYQHVQGFSEDPELTGLDDAEFFVRLYLANAHLVYEPGVVQCWVQHHDNYSSSADFQDARLAWLRRLTELAQNYPLLEAELRHFRFHTHTMRGIYFLENHQARSALHEFRRALAFRPLVLNTYYLLMKSLMISGALCLRPHQSMRQRN